MREKDRHRYPHKAGNGHWYEDESGITVYDGNGNPGMRIQYRHIIAALERAKRRKERSDMDTAKFKEFMFSLAWSQWSAYHNDNAKAIIENCYPELNASEVIKKFHEILNSPPGEGSPK